MSDRVRADIDSLVKLQREQTDLLEGLRVKIDAISELAEELFGRAPEPGRSDERLQAEEALGSLTAGCRELGELFRFEEHAVGEYKEAEAEVTAMLEDLLG